MSKVLCTKGTFYVKFSVGSQRKNIYLMAIKLKYMRLFFNSIIYLFNFLGVI